MVDKGIARDLGARKNFTQYDIVVPGLVNSRDAAAHLPRGTLQYREPFRTEHEVEPVKAISMLPAGETGGQV